MKSGTIAIRKATRNDLVSIVALVHELAVYERAEHEMTTGLETYQTSYDAGHFEAIVAELRGEIIGMALYYRRFSTWKGPMLYLEDFVVKSEYRRRGVGALIFEAYLESAREMGISLCMWQVLDWNTPAMDFYNKYDVQYDEGWYNVKLFI